MSSLFMEICVFPGSRPTLHHVADLPINTKSSETGAGIFTYCGICSRLNCRFSSPHAVSRIKHFCGPLKILSLRLHFNGRSSEMQGFRSYYHWYLSRKGVGRHDSQMARLSLGNSISLCFGGCDLVEESILFS